MSASDGNDSWGWTDSLTGKEYAIIGLNNGTAFIDISDPVNPIYLGKVPTATGNSLWRDIKVYNNHAFIVSEASNHGMQVFDLTRLRNVPSPPATFNADTTYTEFGNAHNIVINEDSGYAYVVGAQRNSGPYSGGPLFINIQDPKNPVNAGGLLSSGQRAYTHDAQVVTYTGPDSDYTGREILIGSNEIEVVIADITDKSNPVTIATIQYSDIGYTHQGWFTENQRYFILGDETDEQGVGFNTRTIIFDFQDLDNPIQHMIYNGPTAAIDHNGYVKGDLFYLANYRAGMRVIDISDIANKNMTEVGFFDTYASSNSASFNGVWNVYPYFTSGNIVISDIEQGFLLLRKSSPAVCDPTTPTAVTTATIGGNQASINWDTVTNATYQIRSRPTGTSSWTTNTATTNTYTITGLTATTTYEVQVRSICADGSTSGYSSTITFTTTDIQLNYCDANGQITTDEFISNVTTGTINNTSGASSGGYGDFTAFTTDFIINNTYPIAITTTWTGTTYSEGYAVWIDFNQDGDFSDANEQVLTQNATQASPVNGSISIPVGAVAGNTRMRIAMKYNGVPTSCESFQYGEVEDYTVNILTDGGGPGNETSCTAEILSYPYAQEFENTLGSWQQSEEDDLDWSINSGGTPSNNTGPTNANQGTYYLYVEASGNNTGYPSKQAIITSPCFDLSTLSTATFSFEYHMYGAIDMGTIALEVSTDDGTSWISIWNETGNKGNSWNTVSVDLSAYTGQTIQLRFNRITGGTWQADIAIDTLTLTTGSAKSTSIVKTNELILSIYPNPAETTIQVSLNTKDFSGYEIKNYIGQLIDKGDVTNTIDISDLTSGIYFFQVVSKDQILSTRFVKK
ncbi:hypothetical protein GCM10022393_05630 [Aquimarina addita]|uniref:Choice-of-anchor B family protein n=2 Tax=Aquimarina addita TaxID=870485 RepID=A0ABP7XAE5_9FLAO